MILNLHSNQISKDTEVLTVNAVNMFVYYGSILLCTVICFYLILKVVWGRITSKYASIYCPSNVPIFGSLLCLELDSPKLHKQLQEFTMRGNNLSVLWFAWKPSVRSAKSEHAKVVLGSQLHLQKAFLYDFLHEWLNTGLLTSYGEKWNHRRRLITPAFHFSILNEFVPIFEKQAQILVDKFMSAANEKKVIDVQVPLSLMTLESMCETSLGISNSADRKAEEYVKTISTLGHQLRIRAFQPLYWSSYIYSLTSYGKQFYKSLKSIHEYTSSAINKRIAIHSETEQLNYTVIDKKSRTKRNVCFIDTLIESYQKGDIDIDGIREEVDTFVFEGHDTTSSGLTFCLYMLGIYKEHQKTLQEEIDEAEGENILEIIQKLKLLDCVIKESLRLYPPVAAIGRRMEEDTVIGGQTFYKDTTIVINIFGLHRNEEYWENPLKFNPYRFMGDEFQQRNPYCYIPFSAGPRNCIGQKFALLEVKICLYYVLKTFNLTSIQAENEIELCTDMITLSQNGVLIKFETR